MSPARRIFRRMRSDSPQLHRLGRVSHPPAGMQSVNLDFRDIAEYLYGKFDVHIARGRRRVQRVAERACPVGRSENRKAPFGLRDRHILHAVGRDGHRNAAGDVDSARRCGVERRFVTRHRTNGAQVDGHGSRKRAESLVVAVLRTVCQLSAVRIERAAVLGV